MKKDVIYVDIEDDITSIIEKVKAASAKIVALVPPKRIGVLQSVVNLKLLQRAAAGVDKRVVLITNNQSLSSLAASVAIPVAKNLQTKPELATVKAVEPEDEDVIRGDELPVGDLAATAPATDATDSRSIVINSTAAASAPSSTAKPLAPAVVAAGAKPAADAKAKKGPKVPNFDKFRKILFISGALLILLAGFLVWAIVYAPRGVVNITAKTSPYDVRKALMLRSGAALDSDGGVVPYVTQEIQKTRTVDFTPTGKKEVGEKATGTITLTNDTESDPVSIPAGAAFTTSTGLRFVADAAATVPGAEPPFSGGRSQNPGVEEVAVTAAEIGENYNVGPQSVVSNNVSIKAEFESATSGGSKRQVTVVSDEDVAAAKSQLTAQPDTDVKTELARQFQGDVIVVQESYAATAGDPTVSPAVGAEAQAAKLTAETRYTMIAVTRSDLAKVLEADINTQIQEEPNQKVFESGIDAVSFSDFGSSAPGQYTAVVSTTGYVGPRIEADDVISQSAGKRAGEIQADIQKIEGVESVDVELSPFWVARAPSGDKLTVNFIIDDGAN